MEYHIIKLKNNLVICIISNFPYLCAELKQNDMQRNDYLWKGILKDINITFEHHLDQITGRTEIMGLEELILRASKHEGMKLGMERGMEQGRAERDKLRARIAELEQIISKNKHKS